MLKTLEKYLQELMGVDIAASAWESNRLPPYLRNGYKFYEGELLETPCLFMMDRGQEEQTPATIDKHIKQVMKKYDGEVIYVLDRITHYSRKRLIEEKIPFIVPGTQLYLPPLGLDLREYFRAQRKKIRQKLSPAAQACLLLFLLTQGNGSSDIAYTSSSIAERLGYSRMTINRAFKELDELNLNIPYEEYVKDPCGGKSLQKTDAGKGLWEAALPFFRTPVKKRHYLLIDDTIGISAGLSAVADYSMLAAPRNRVVAVSAAEWNELKRSDQITELNIPEADAVEVEVWSYEPKLFASNKSVDKLSLYLSLKDNEDERVQMALDEMMENYKWS